MWTSWLNWFLVNQSKSMPVNQLEKTPLSNGMNVAPLPSHDGVSCPFQLDLHERTYFLRCRSQRP